MYDSKRIISILVISLSVSCATGKTEPVSAPAPAPPAEIPVAEPPPVAMKEAPPAAPAPAAPVTPTVQVWKVKKGKMPGQPKALLINKFKNKKLPGFTSDICYNYKTFAIVETKSTGEMGSAEVVIRYVPTCVPEYKGKYANLNMIEGHLAGVAGDYIVIDGDDPSEALRQFQIVKLETGKEVYKGYHHPDEDIVLTKKDGVTSLVFYGQVKVKCELASDGEACWKKVIEQNEMKPGSPMPDCKAAFEQAKIGLFEMALVTAKARVANLASPKLEYLGGKSTCVPAPP